MAGKEIILYRVPCKGRLEKSFKMLVCRAIEKRIYIYLEGTLGVGFNRFDKRSLRLYRIGKTPIEAIDLFIAEEQLIIKSYSNIIKESKQNIKDLIEMRKEYNKCGDE